MKIIDQFLFTLSFFTMIPVKGREFAGLKLGQGAWAFPIIGAIIGAWAAVIYSCLLWLHFSPALAAWVAVFMQIILTGGLHEDGLADTADGLASGRNKEQKLAIMRDSRIGSYGVMALVVVLALRANALAEVKVGYDVLAIMAGAGAFSRSLLVLMMRATPPARADGLFVSAGRPSGLQTAIALLIGGVALLLAKPLYFLSATLIMMVIFFVVRSAVRKNFGGITGDTLGALQQISEATVLAWLVR